MPEIVESHSRQLRFLERRTEDPVQEIVGVDRLAVCALVIKHGGDEDEAVAALLHDTLEDHSDKVTREDLHNLFGERVAKIVEDCTDTPPGTPSDSKPPWDQRKRTYIEHLRLVGPPSARVALADKLHNARAILADCRVLGDELWPRFNAGKKDELCYLRKLVDVFRGVAAPDRMLQEFDGAVSEIERLAQGL